MKALALVVFLAPFVAHADAIDDLARAIIALPKDGDAAKLAMPKGVSLHIEGDGFVLTFSPVVDATTLARAFHWTQPYALSGDVHQTSWQLELKDGDLDDPFNKRIATKSPRAGAHTAHVTLDARPPGDLPKIVAGASPAYDLMKHKAKVITAKFSP